MILETLDSYFRSILSIGDLEKADSSMNGVQVGRMKTEIGKAAFAVDACMRSFSAAKSAGADFLFVHHGLFWGRPLAVTGVHYERLEYLVKNEMALYAVHLPLDMHPAFGNNAAIVDRLKLEKKEEFGLYKGFSIGWKGILPGVMTLDEIISALGLNRDDCLALLPFGPEKIKSIAVIAGGATHEVEQAIDAEADLYITGEASHVMYHQALEGKINVIAAGHYNSETWGVRLLSEKCAADTGIETVFIDSPTGL